MSAWFSQKPRLTPHGQYPPEITRAIHTMADDLAGKAIPEVSHQPLVAFQPGQTGEAAFYAAPAIQEPVATASVPMSNEAPSPFLTEAAPGTVPPETVPVLPPPPSEEAMLLDQMQALEQSIPVAVKPYAADALPPSGRAPSLWERIKQAKSKLGIGLGIGVLVLSVGFGGWYWWQSRGQSAKPIVSEAPIQETAPVAELKVQEPLPQPPQAYSATQPNLFSFNTETVTAESISIEFLKVARAIEQEALRQPIEFLVRDQNYNPLAFSRFAYLLGLTLPADLLTTLDEPFSLYFYLDQDRPRMGLAVTIRDKAAFQQMITTTEALLPKIFEPLYLDKTTAPKTDLAFRSGLYREQLVRFVNIDAAMNLTFDYAVREQLWIIGTSQATLRALLDRQNP